MTNGSHPVTRDEVNALRDEVNALRGELTALERRHVSELREITTRTLNLEHYASSAASRLRKLERKRERDEQRLMLAGWGVAFAVIGVVVDVAVRIVS